MEIRRAPERSGLLEGFFFPAGIVLRVGAVKPVWTRPRISALCRWVCSALPAFQVRLWIALAQLVLVLLCAGSARAEPELHVVAPGHTLGKIAHRYHTTIAAICHANGIERRSAIRPGQKLWIPDKNDKDGSKTRALKLAREASRREDAKEEPKQAPDPGDPTGMATLDVPGIGTVYYYAPVGPGRFTLRPVLMYLHGRGGQPARDCPRWANVARPLGWLVCPSGPGAMGHGRGWNNNWAVAHHIAKKALEALRAKYGRRVQLYGNTLIGFSEGAYAAMNVGVREPRAFNRWLILAANNTYWGGPGLEQLKVAKSLVRRVYLITGEQDGVVEGTRAVREWLRQYGIPTRITTPPALGHEVLLETKPELYRMALVWLDRGNA